MITWLDQDKNKASSIGKFEPNALLFISKCSVRL